MNHNDTTIEKSMEGDINIKSVGRASCLTMVCDMKGGADGGNADYMTTIKISSGQTFKDCDFEVCGAWERRELLEFLKEVILQMELQMKLPHKI